MHKLFLACTLAIFLITIILGGCETVVNSENYKTSELAASFRGNFGYVKSKDCMYYTITAGLSVGSVDSREKIKLVGYDTLFLEYGKDKREMIEVEDATFGPIALYSRTMPCMESGKKLYVRLERKDDSDNSVNSYIVVPHNVELLEDIKDKEFSRKGSVEVHWKKNDGVDEIEWHVSGGCIINETGISSETPLFFSMKTEPYHEKETCTVELSLRRTTPPKVFLL